MQTYRVFLTGFDVFDVQADSVAPSMLSGYMTLAFSVGENRVAEFVLSQICGYALLGESE